MSVQTPDVSPDIRPQSRHPMSVQTPNVSPDLRASPEGSVASGDVVVECYCFITIIIVGAVDARCVIISYVLHHVLVCQLRNPPFYFIKL